MRIIGTALSLLIVMTLAVNAQTDKGCKMIGGNFGGFIFSNISKGEDDRNKYEYRRISLQPNMGYFLADDVLIGIMLSGRYDYNNQSHTGQYYSKHKTTNWGISAGPFFRLYGKISDKFKTFGQFGGTAGYGRTHSVELHAKDRGYIILINTHATAGIEYTLNKNWGVEASLGGMFYTYEKFDYGKHTDLEYRYETNSDFDFNFSISSFNLGLKYYY